MQFYRNAILSGQILAAHKLRTLLNMIGVVVGVGAVILMVSVGRGAEKRILERIGKLGTNLVIVNAAPARLMIGRQRTVATVTTLLAADAYAIAGECPHVIAIAPVVRKSFIVRWEDNNTTTSVIGMGADGFKICNIPIASGRLFEADEDRTRQRVAVIGPTVVKNIFDKSNPVGQSLLIGRVLFDVIGVTRPRGLDANGLDQDDIVLVPLETAMRRLLNVSYIHSIYIQARSSQWLDEVEREVRDLLRERQRLAEGRPDTFTIQNQKTLLKTERDAARSLTLLIGSVAGIALLVGGVGILAVMLISIRERTHEIGLRRALGARPYDIRVQFLVEAALLSGVGGILGVIAGISAARITTIIGFWETLISWPAAFIAFSFSLIMGVVFGIYPALRASKLEPIQALKSE